MILTNRWKILTLRIKDLSHEYTKLCEQINRLPDDEYNKLLATLLGARKTDKLKTKNDLRELLLKAPTWSDEQWESFQENLSHFRQH